LLLGLSHPCAEPNARITIMKPIYEEVGRTILKVQKLFKKTKDGEIVDISREAKVIETTHPELKKGDMVYYNPRGCINLEILETKKEIVMCVDNVDIYVRLK
jgi:co-chaperonin GroES (HSP10)